MPKVDKITRLFLCLSETSLLGNVSGFLPLLKGPHQEPETLLERQKVSQHNA